LPRYTGQSDPAIALTAGAVDSFPSVRLFASVGARTPAPAPNATDAYPRTAPYAGCSGPGRVNDHARPIGSKPRRP
jgi:hypothetical protein